MKKMIAFVLLVLASTGVYGEEVDLDNFARQYFSAFVDFQLPEANSDVLDKYLDYLAVDVGHTHMPFRKDDTKYADGRDRYRKDLLSMMGKNKKLKAKLLEVRVFNTTAVALRFELSATYVDTDKDIVSPWSFVLTDILEIEDGKVSMIRRYHD